MYANTLRRGSPVMTDHDDDVIRLATERFERRLAEDNAKLRVEMATEFGRSRAETHELRAEMKEGFGALRAEMIDRNAELLKWALIFGATQTAALTGVIVALR